MKLFFLALTAVMAVPAVAIGQQSLGGDAQKSFDDAIKRIGAPDVVAIGDLRLEPFSDDVNYLARSITESYDNGAIHVLGKADGVDNICSLYGYKLTDKLQELTDLQRGSEFLNYLTDSQYDSWLEGNQEWYDLRERKGGGQQACAQVAKETPNMLVKVR